MREVKGEYYVYRYTDTSSGDVVYIGKTNCSLKARINAHKREASFAPYNCAVDCVRLSNKVETDSVEKFLINYYKPCINLKDKVPMLTKSIELSGLDWIPYEEYLAELKCNKGRVGVLKKEAIKQSNIAGKVFGATEFSILLPDMVFLMPTLDGYLQFADKYMTMERSSSGEDMFRHKLLPESVMFIEEHYYEILAAIWRPVVQASDLGSKTLDGFASCEYAFDALDALSSFASNGYQSEDYPEPFVAVLPMEHKCSIPFLEGAVKNLAWRDMGGKLYIEWAHGENDAIAAAREAVCKYFVQLVRAEGIWPYDDAS